MSNSGNNLIQAIKDSEFQNVTGDILESILDTQITDGFLKDIPIIGTIVGTYNAATSIKDKLFIKKLLTFLYELKSVPPIKIEEQITKLEKNNTYKTKVGEKLLFLIDKCDDIDKSSLVGTLFKKYLEEEISYDDFLATTSCIERTPLPDLLNFIQNDFDEINTEGGGSEYVSYGLMEIRVSQPSIQANNNSGYYDYEHHVPSDEEIMASKLEISDFKIRCYVSWIGDIIRKHLR